MTSTRRLPHVSAARQRQLQRLFRVLQACGTELAARVALALYQLPSRRQLDAEDVGTLARARVRFIGSPVGRLRLLEWGSDDGAGTVLLVHGWGSHAPRWTTFVEAIEARGWRAVALDLPGHGRSAGRRSNLLRCRSALQAALAELGALRGIVAHSLGALATTAVLAQRPVVPVGAVVLVSLPQDLDYLLGSFEDLLGLRPATRQRLRALFALRFGRPPEGFSAAGWLAGTPCPVLRLHDQDDDIVPVAQADALEGCPGSGPSRRSAGLGHSGPLRDAGMAGIALDFLSDPTATPRWPAPR